MRNKDFIVETAHGERSLKARFASRRSDHAAAGSTTSASAASAASIIPYGTE